jgi:hypothetical protein
MSAIGGYLELELQLGARSYHDSAYAFKSARSSLHYLLNKVRPSLVYLPFYTCNALLESFLSTETSYAFYEINEGLQPKSAPELKEGEYFLYPNYFDINRSFVAELTDKYEDRLIVDNAQAFFMKGNGRSWFFNSCRKFFGVPDGSYLYVPNTIDDFEAVERNETYNFDHLLKRFNGHVREGYKSFVENEKLCGGEIKGMSKLTEYLLSHIDYEEVSRKRRENFSYLHEIYKDINLIEVRLNDLEVPMVYPLLLEGELKRDLLYEKDLFIPKFWEDVLTRSPDGFQTERFLTKNMFPLPIDHRYDLKDMETMVSIIKSIQ